MRQDAKFIKEVIKKKEKEILELCDHICSYAELAYEEFRSAAELCAVLEREGFSVRRGIAGMPTAFMGSYGSGKPVMGILGEYDALDGLSQEPGVAERSPREGIPAGHGCGHCCLGSASLGAALAVKAYLKKHGLPGTIVYYGCPAEEGAGSKQFMAREGLFDGLDFVYTWHPSAWNEVSADRTMAIMGANFEFKGRAAHAGGAPWLGRSALDAAELMNVGCNYLREHIPDGQRVHYAYADAGSAAPNVVPDYARIKYEVRARSVAEAEELFRRVENCAKGAALMTGTEERCIVTMAFSDFTQNSVLAETASQCFLELGAPEWGEEDFRLAERFLDSCDEAALSGIRRGLFERFGERAGEMMKRPLHTDILPYDRNSGRTEGGSTDVGDVSYVVPTAVIHVASYAVGTAGHSWQIAAQSGSAIGHRGLLRAAEVLALSCIRMMGDGERIARAAEETRERSGGSYSCPLPASLKPPIGSY